jgi:uncharacterized delta-60 repeat protein
MKRIIFILFFINGYFFLNAQIIDKGFNPKIATNGIINGMVSQLDGKLIVVGDFVVDFVLNDTLRTTRNIIRYLSNGDLDTDFLRNVGSGANSRIRSLKINPVSGDIYLVGDFTIFNSREVNRFVCLNDDGTLDESFQAKMGDGFAQPVNSIEIQPDSKIIIAGLFEVFNGIRVNRMIRLYPNGDLDMSFINKTTAIPIMNSQINAVKYHKGKLIVGGNFTDFFGNNRIARFDTTGNIDAAFSANNGNGFNRVVTFINVQEDDKILICGQFTAFAGNSSSRYLVRLNWGGGQDITFKIAPSNFVLGTMPLSNKRQLIVGDFRTINGISSRFMAIMDSLGNLDEDFAQSIGSLVNNTISTIERLPDNLNSYVFGGNFDQINGVRTSIGYVKETGELSLKENSLLTKSMRIITILEQSDKKILISGEKGYVDGYSVNRLFRLFPNGKLDTLFVQNIGLGPNNDVLDIKIQYPDSLNSIIAVGDIITFNEKFVGRVIRLDSNGVLDSTFVANHTNGNSTNNTVNSVVVQRDGRGIIVTGEFTQFFNLGYLRLVKMDENGTLVPSDEFRANKINNGINSEIKSISELSDGTIVAVGTFTTFYDIPAGRIARFATNGTLISNFIATGGDLTIDKAFVQENDKIILTGNFENFNGLEKYRVARINKNGGLDNDFKFKLMAGSTDFINNIAFQKTGGEEKMIVGGRFSDYVGVRRYLQRLNNDGSLDVTFDPKIPIDTVCQVFAVSNQSNPDIKDILVANLDLPGSLIRLITPPPPSTPLNLIARANIGDFQVDLEWEYRQDSVFFQVERSTNLLSGYEVIYRSNLLTQLPTDNIIRFSDKSVTNDIQYYYRVKALNQGNGSSYSNVETIIFTDLVTAQETELFKKIKIYPNPTSSKIILDLSETSRIFDKPIMAEIYNQQGQIVQKFTNLLAKKNELDTANLANGLYIIKLILTNQVIYKKVIKY